MIMSAPSAQTSARIGVRLLFGHELKRRLPELEPYALRGKSVPLSRHPRWLTVLEQGLRHVPYMLEAFEGERTTGLLPLAFVHSFLFGRFLVSLPYLNSNGVLADDDATRRQLIDEAVLLADRLKVRHLELRHEQPVEHAALTGRLTSKVHMRLALPEFPGPLWEGLSGKVRNQVRKGEKSGLTVAWGGLDLLPEFYAVFSQNMRDLGTPVYSRGLFASILKQFPGEAELCVVRAGETPAAGASFCTAAASPRCPALPRCGNTIPPVRTCSCTGTCSTAPCSAAKPCSISAAPPWTAIRSVSRNNGEPSPNRRSGNIINATARPVICDPTTRAISG